MTCPEYCGDACVGELCPYGYTDDFIEEPVTCDSCWYYKGCEDCHLINECDE